jgi:hypothetical protein
VIGTAAQESQNIILGARTGGSGARLTGDFYDVVLVDTEDLDLFWRLRDWCNGGTPNAFADPTGGASGSASPDAATIEHAAVESSATTGAAKLRRRQFRIEGPGTP